MRELLENLVKCQDLWPALKVTSQLTTVNDLTLLPRAMQCDEDMARTIDEYKSILAARKLQTEEIRKRQQDGRLPYSSRPIHSSNFREEQPQSSTYSNSAQRQQVDI